MEMRKVTWEIMDRTLMGDWFLPVIIVVPIIVFGVAMLFFDNTYTPFTERGEVGVSLTIAAVVAAIIFGVNTYVPVHKNKITTDVSPVLQLENARTIDGKLRASSEEAGKHAIEVHPASVLVQEHRRGEELEGVLMCRQNKCFWVTEDEAEKKEYAQAVLNSRILRLAESYR